jgi:hypothetical protein
LSSRNPPCRDHRRSPWLDKFGSARLSPLRAVSGKHAAAELSNPPARGAGGQGRRITPKGLACRPALVGGGGGKPANRPRCQRIARRCSCRPHHRHHPTRTRTLDHPGCAGTNGVLGRPADSNPARCASSCFKPQPTPSTPCQIEASSLISIRMTAHLSCLAMLACLGCRPAHPGRPGPGQEPGGRRAALRRTAGLRQGGVACRISHHRWVACVCVHKHEMARHRCWCHRLCAKLRSVQLTLCRLPSFHRASGKRIHILHTHTLHTH